MPAVATNKMSLAAPRQPWQFLQTGGSWEGGEAGSTTGVILLTASWRNCHV